MKRSSSRQTFQGVHLDRFGRQSGSTDRADHAARASLCQPTVCDPGGGQSFIDFACDYVCQTPLAKGYGTFPTYHVRRVGRR